MRYLMAMRHENILRTSCQVGQLLKHRYISATRIASDNTATVWFVAMVFSDYVKQRILFYHQQGCISRNILLGEGLIVSHVGIYRFLKTFKKCGTLARRRGSGRPSKITDEVKRIVEAQMQLDDETTAVQLRALLAQKGAYYLD